MAQNLESEKKINRYIKLVNQNEDPKKIELEYMNILTNLIVKNRLRIYSFVPARSKENGFEIFKFKIQFAGYYSSIVDLFIQVNKFYKYIFVKNCSLKRSDRQLINASVNFEIPVKRVQ